MEMLLSNVKGITWVLHDQDVIDLVTSMWRYSVTISICFLFSLMGLSIYFTLSSDLS